MTEFTGRFHIGQIVKHRRFGYRGVVYDADPEFTLSEDWYERVARSRPPKDQPWYHVLVDGADQVTYVAERNLEAVREDGRPIDHPLIETYFRGFNGRTYEARALTN
jgi:heat shock protein HspQ